MLTRHFHFDLFFNGDNDFSVPLKLSVRGRKYDVVPHTADSLAATLAENESLRHIHRLNPNALTHYATVPDHHLPQDRLSYLIVEEARDPSDPHRRSAPYVLAFHIPETEMKRYFSQKVREIEAMASPGSPEYHNLVKSHMHPGFHHYGMGTESFPAVDAAHMVELNVGQNHHVTPMDVATSLLFHHPQLATSRMKEATKVIMDHIQQVSNPNKTQYGRITALATQIASMGKPGPNSGWASSEEAKDIDGKPVKAEYQLKGKDGKVIFDKGQQLYNYELNPKLDSAIGSPLSHSMSSTRRDPSLRTKHWGVNQGKGALTQEKNGTSQPQAETRSLLSKKKGRKGQKLEAFSDAFAEEVAAAASDGGFTFVEKSPGHGLTIDTASIKFKQGDNNKNEWGSFSFDVSNIFLRQLGAYVEFFTDQEMKKSIANPKAGNKDWGTYFTKALTSAFETDNIKGIGTIPNVDTIMGIPLEGDPTTLSCDWPEEAQAAKFYFGSIGTSNNVKPIIWPGVIMTAIFQYGLPLFFVIGGTALTTTKFYKKIIGNKVFKILIFQLALVIVKAFTSEAISGASIMTTFGKLFLSLMGKAEFLQISVPVAAQIAAGEAEDAVPVVGLAFRIANIAITTINILETTGEVLSSPGVLEASVKRQMSLHFTLHPDPKHGEPNDLSSAIWPLVGDHVEMVLTYTNGTNYKHKQDLPKTSSNAPLNFVFDDIGWGGQMKIVANVYSKNGWLCGQFKSPLLDAVPGNPNDKQGPYIMKQSGNIKEFLVPLTQDTQYQYKQKLSYDTQDKLHKWEVGSVPLATQADLSCSAAGNQLCKLVDITINDKAFQIGYAYQASNQGIPLSGSGKPTNSQMYVFQNISALADATLQKRLKQSKVGFDLQPYILYDKYGQGPSKTEISPYNFIVDPRNGAYYLRQVNLTDGTHDFGLTQTPLKSYGRFTIPHLDAIVFHESGYAIAASFIYSRVQILKLDLAKGPVEDKDAPTAGVLSGPGMLQGLTLGPVSMKITPDGRILILETLNRRVQAFDIKGNPVPSFPGKVRFTAPAQSFSADLDNKTFPDNLQALFDSKGLTKLFLIPDASQLTASLDSNTLTTKLINAFSDELVYLTYNKDSQGKIDPQGSTFITTLTAGQKWRLTDPNKNFIYTLVLDGSDIQVFDKLNAVTVQVVGKGKKWIVNDLAGARSYLLEVGSGPTSQLEVKDYRSYFWLGERSRTTAPPQWLAAMMNDRFTEPIGNFIYYNLKPGITQAQAKTIVADAVADPLNPSSLPYLSDVTYLDIAVESKGYMYVLYFKNDGSKNTDYYVDIFDPTGNYLVTTPDARLHKHPNAMQHVSAARLAIDLFRNMFTLNYEAFGGAAIPGSQTGRTEPSISTWIPTPPMFTLPVSDLPTLQGLNITQVGKLLKTASKGNLDLSAQATIKAVPPQDNQGKYSHFQITDGTQEYDIITSLEYGGTPQKDPASATQKIFVYNILA